jgi:hypothetical protein
MLVLFYFSVFFMFLLFGAIVITGFYSVTRGSIKTMPDGTKRKEGQLLRDWYLFWYQEAREWQDTTTGLKWRVKKKRFQYVGNELTKIVQAWQNTGAKFGISNYYQDRIVVASHPDQRTIDMYAQSLGLLVVLDRGQEGIEVKFYMEEIEFMFPWWVRKMLAGCITCHSSWLGSIIFWTGYFCAVQYGVAINSNLLVILSWVSYCFALAFLSPYLYKKVS